MPNKHIENAPPLLERPRCRWCGKYLKPHYESHRERTGDFNWRPATEADMASGDPDDPEGSPYSVNAEFRRGLWRIGYRAETVVFRKFLGTYGLDSLFCNQTHAVDWACANAEALVRGETLQYGGTVYVSTEYADDGKNRKKKIVS